MSLDKNLDPFVRAVALVFCEGDPLGFAKVFGLEDEYSCEAKEVVRHLRSVQFTNSLTSQLISQICIKAFLDNNFVKNRSGKNWVTSFQKWNELAEVILWLYNNENLWTID